MLFPQLYYDFVMYFVCEIQICTLSIVISGLTTLLAFISVFFCMEFIFLLKVVIVG
jgi:hypothetical protein